jgi:TolB protein
MKPLARLGMLAICIAWQAQAAPAQVEVVKAMNEVSLLDISAFKSRSDGPPELFRRTLEADLLRSEYFKLVSGRAEFTLVGEVNSADAGIAAHCEAFNTVTRERLLSRSYRGSADETRRLAHKAADEIVQALTGNPGMAASRFVLVGNRTGHKELYLCDADGQNLRPLTQDKTLSLAPKWGPDGNQIVYTSFRSHFPDVYLITLAGNAWKSRCLASYPGLNTCAAISPDGREAALTLSKDGNPDLFIMNLADKRLTRLTNTPRAGEASPAWSPDGRQLVFVSDRSGTPQLYIIDRSGGEPTRIPSAGSQNVDPDWGANGFIAYSSLIGSLFQVFIFNPKTQQMNQLTREDASYEDPSWAPDRRHLACTRTERYRARIFIIDMLTRSSISLLPDSTTGDWSAPAWSPK